MRHRQSLLAKQPLAGVRHIANPHFCLILTQNVEGNSGFDACGFDGPVEAIVNDRPKCYGANRNVACARCTAPYFCVINLDLCLPSDAFPALVPRSGIWDWALLGL